MNTLNLTPTWEGLVPAFIALIENGTTEGRSTAITEITRMAQIADQAVAASKADKACYLVAHTTNHGDNDLRDDFSIHETQIEAEQEYEHLITTKPDLHCACVAKIITATEPHWTGM